MDLSSVSGESLLITTGRLRWLRAMILVGVLYSVVGVLFATIAGSAPSNQLRVAWRLAAWVISAAAFAAHIGYEQIRLRSGPGRTAFHASLAVGLGAFALAIKATVHAQNSSTHEHFPPLALAIWPVATALPAFVVALALAFGLARARRNA